MTAVLAFGAQFFLHNGTVLTEAAEILSISPPATTAESIDSTTHGSADGFREFIAGLADGGEISLTLHYIPGSAGDTLLRGQVAARTVRAFKIEVNAQSGQEKIEGNCVPTSYAPGDLVIDDKQTATFTAKVSGKPTQAAVA